MVVEANRRSMFCLIAPRGHDIDEYIMERRQLTVLCLLLGIECGSGFVGRGLTGKGWWTGRNAPQNTVGQRQGDDDTVGRQRGTTSRRCGPPAPPPPTRQHRSIESILGIHPRLSLHKARQDDNDESDRKDTSKRKKNESRTKFLPSLFADLLNMNRGQKDDVGYTPSTAGDTKPDLRRTNSKQKADQRKESTIEGNKTSNSGGWLPRFFSGGGQAGKTMTKLDSKNPPVLRKEQSTQQRSKVPTPASPPPPPAKASTTTTKKSSPLSFNPLLYVQTAWKNTAFPFFDNNNGDAKDEWSTVFQTSRIMPGESVPITVRGLDLLVVASLDGRSLYCIANSCPHLGTPLETGQLTRLPIEEATTFVDTARSSTSTAAPDMFGASTAQDQAGLILSETQVSEILSQDGCEDCIICPLHRTAFALRSGAVRGSWCPYPPLLGPALGIVKGPTAATTYEVRTRGKNVQVKLLRTTKPAATATTA